MHVALVFPHQLFDPSSHPAVLAAAQRGDCSGETARGRKMTRNEEVASASRVVVVEEHLFFTQYAFQAGKLAFQRAAMRQFAHDVHAVGGVRPVYVNATSPLHDIRTLVPALAGVSGGETPAPVAKESASGATPWLAPADTEAELSAAMGGAAASELHVCDVADDYLRRRLTKAATAAGLTLNWVASPNFLTAPADFEPYFEEQKRTSKRPFYFAKFYTWQRQRLGILLNKDGASPVGGKWSFDSENRKKVPKGTTPPAIPVPPLAARAASPTKGGGKNTDDAIDIDAEDDADVPVAAAILDEALRYVTANFGGDKTYGSLEPWQRLAEAWKAARPNAKRLGGSAAAVTPFPFTRDGAAAMLEDFVAGPRMRGFGDYEDAMLTGDAFLWHSLLSTSINAGLLSPRVVVDRVLQEHKDKPSHAPLAGTEGFVRQVIGWREFVRAVYEVDGRRQRTCNSYGFTRKMPEAFWNGESGIAPVDTVTRRVLRHGYCHHIERLMVTGCFFLLCEIRPDDVYEWFSALFIDAFDWVMVPNVYGMSQGSDGGVMMTKPYVCGSNYLLKMGDWDKSALVHFGAAAPATKAALAAPKSGKAGSKKGAAPPAAASKGGRTWAEVWDGLFWRFLSTHRDRIRANPRLGMLVGTFDKMAAEKREKLLGDAQWYLDQLDAAKPHHAPK
jgi:deoxyribodipyrimidine photolyase-related protein